MKIWRKVQDFVGCKFLVVRRDGTVPHWPYFVLGARDPSAPAALSAYAKDCELRGVDPEYVESILELLMDFHTYRLDQGSGDPEAPPHRKDNPRVIAVMRGEEAYIQVVPDKGNLPK